MTAPSYSAHDIARFLQDNPDFFTDHAHVFADIKVPHPHQAQAISLGERQIMVLRARTRELEWQLSGLIHNATGNERISKLLISWCARLLSEDDAQRLPALITDGLSQLFDLPDIALRVWNLSRVTADSPYTQDVTHALQQDIQNRSAPYCGPVNDHDAAAWLPNPPASMALLPLTTGDATRSVGALVLGSPDAARFTEDMGTEFLQTISTLAGAALGRLDDSEQPEPA